MPTGQKIVTPAYTGATPPFRSDTDVMISDGTLFLFDPGHNSTGLTGVPVSGQILYNLAWKNAARIIGSGTAATLGATYNQVGMTGTAGKVERSGKGGLAHICSKTNMVAANGYDIELPDLIKTFLIANPTATIGVTAVRRITRAATPASGSLFRHFVISATAGVAANYLAQILQTVIGLAANPPVGDPTFIGRTLLPAAGTGTTGGELADLAVKGFVGTVPANAAAMRAGYYAGDRPTQVTGTPLQQYGSSVLYRVGLEVLSGVTGVTGRSFLDYSTASQAWFTKHVQTAGGRYFGDTFTDPATIP